MKASSLTLDFESGLFVNGDFGSSLAVDGIVTGLSKDPSLALDIIKTGYFGLNLATDGIVIGLTGRLVGTFDCIRI